MSEILLVLFIIAIIFFIFNNLNNKIRRLEKEVSDLTTKINQPLQDREIQVLQHEQKPVEEIKTQNTAQQPDVHEKILADNRPSPPQKDWLEPVFDFLKQNILTIVGIFTLVLGLGYFVKYAIDKNWIGETSRAGIGFVAGTGIMLLGHFLRKNYAVFASIITGGGISVLYFTATIGFQEYHLFTQNTAFVITTLITIISIALAHYYKSEILIIFAMLGGFLAPLMISTGKSNYLFLFTYLTLLNIGMLATSLLKHWKSVGWTAYIFTSMYLFYWTSEKPELLSIVFYIISYIIFYIFALQDYIKKNTLSTSDTLMLVLINFSSIIGLVYTFKTLSYEPVIIFPLVFAAGNGVLLLREYGKKSFGFSYSIFAALTISLVTVAVALQFKTHLITSVWAIEASLLVYLWKKSGHPIFKTCFYVLFPLMIIAQMMTWTEYFHKEHMGIIFNPVFLTSLVTVSTTVLNLFLLKKTSEPGKKDDHFFENVFAVVSYGVIYIALLLEIIYHISDMPWAAMLSIGLLFSIYYLFILILLRKKLDIDGRIQVGLIYLFLILIAFNSSLAASEVVTVVLRKQLTFGFYTIHLLQWIPFVYILWNAAVMKDFYKTKTSYLAISVSLVIGISYGFYNTYILSSSTDISSIYKIKEHFTILYLPIIWTVLASIFIYVSLKKNIPEYSRIGFILIGIMVLKLYSYDVWQMDNISRITAFIILGVILLLSSFTFQRLKNIIKNMVDKKEEEKKN
ncbi:DUF2339 domain-containing protein [Chryseobacterium carnipullorum]|uniref:DUF2339 domain-containing protein n=1 Tax=Chryseobacterium carnipullorum TaxID=1124835 RepID=A0A3G6NCQ7_CHRCU|nr:DUF2339 domain-containing protein [Chryseobacterium carnipullorum]AZA50801.1 DUF2339 domain-containing protein [Chryseobacterium carnipullorum]AZA65664.1 DUF2339 domain-containing protein [Chryseobacterium carnipullorum]